MWGSLLLVGLVCTVAGSNDEGPRNMDVDFVYTWVNQENELQETQRADLYNEQLLSEPLFNSHNSHKLSANFARHPHFFENSLRASLHMTPWVRRIHVVMSDADHHKVPDWLAKMDKVVTVPHSAIFPDAHDLPTHNSFAIECWLHRIPDLAEHFVYFNDDMMVGKQLDKGFFFSRDGKPHLWVDHSLGILDSRDHREKGCAYWATIAHSNELIRESSLANKLSGKAGAYHVPEHQAKPMTKSLLAAAANQFQAAIALTSRSRFRSRGNVWSIHLAMQIGLASGRVAPKANQHFLFGMIGTDKERNARLAKQLSQPSHTLICINRDHAIQGADQMIDQAMASLLKDVPPLPTFADNSNLLRPVPIPADPVPVDVSSPKPVTAQPDSVPAWTATGLSHAHEPVSNADGTARDQSDEHILEDQQGQHEPPLPKSPKNVVHLAAKSNKDHRDRQKLVTKMVPAGATKSDVAVSKSSARNDGVGHKRQGSAAGKGKEPAAHADTGKKLGKGKTIAIESYAGPAGNKGKAKNDPDKAQVVTERVPDEHDLQTSARRVTTKVASKMRQGRLSVGQGTRVVSGHVSHAAHATSLPQSADAQAASPTGTKPDPIVEALNSAKKGAAPGATSTQNTGDAAPELSSKTDSGQGHPAAQDEQKTQDKKDKSWSPSMQVATIDASMPATSSIGSTWPGLGQPAGVVGMHIGGRSTTHVTTKGAGGAAAVPDAMVQRDAQSSKEPQGGKLEEAMKMVTESSAAKAIDTMVQGMLQRDHGESRGGHPAQAQEPGQDDVTDSTMVVNGWREHRWREKYECTPEEIQNNAPFLAAQDLWHDNQEWLIDRADLGPGEGCLHASLLYYELMKSPLESNETEHHASAGSHWGFVYKFADGSIRDTNLCLDVCDVPHFHIPASLYKMVVLGLGSVYEPWSMDMCTWTEPSGALGSRPNPVYEADDVEYDCHTLWRAQVETWRRWQNRKWSSHNNCRHVVDATLEHYDELLNQATNIHHP